MADILEGFSNGQAERSQWQIKAPSSRESQLGESCAFLHLQLASASRNRPSFPAPPQLYPDGIRALFR